MLEGKEKEKQTEGKIAELERHFRAMHVQFPCEVLKGIHSCKYLLSLYYLTDTILSTWSI